MLCAKPQASYWRHPMRHLLAVLLFLPTATYAQDVKYSSPKEVKASFKKLLDRPKVPFDVKSSSAKSDGKTKQEFLSIATEKKPDGTIERMPLSIKSPAGVKG